MAYQPLSPRQLHALLLNGDTTLNELYATSTKVNDIHYEIKQQTGELRAVQHQLQDVANDQRSTADVHRVLIALEKAIIKQSTLLSTMDLAIKNAVSAQDQINSHQSKLTDALNALHQQQSAITSIRDTVYNMILAICGNDQETIDRKSLIPSLETLAHNLDMSIVVKPAEVAVQHSYQGYRAPMDEVTFVTRTTDNPAEMYALLSDLTSQGTLPTTVAPDSTFGNAIHRVANSFSAALESAMIEAIEEYQGPELILYGHTRRGKWSFDNPYEDWGFHPIKDATTHNPALTEWTLKKPFVSNKTSIEEFVTSYVRDAFFGGKRPFYDTFTPYPKSPNKDTRYDNNTEFSEVINLYLDRDKDKVSELVARYLDEADIQFQKDPVNGYDSQYLAHSMRRVFEYLKTISPDRPILLLHDRYGYDYNAFLLPISVLTAIREKLGLDTTFDDATHSLRVPVPLFEMDW